MFPLLPLFITMFRVPLAGLVTTLHFSTEYNFVTIDTPGGNLSLKIKSRAQQITLKPNIIKVNILIS
jgi:hypothetical protein